MKKIILISMIFILMIIMSLILFMSKQNKTINSLSTNKIAYLFETENGNIKGTFDDWLSEDYRDYVLDINNSSCNNNNDFDHLYWDDNAKEVILTDKQESNCTLLFRIPTLLDVCPKDGNLLNCIQNLGEKNKKDVGDGELLRHSDELESGAKDGGYRYSGNMPDNYICFGAGSEEYNQGLSKVCPTGNKYRIIGLVPVQLTDGTQKSLVKVIKAEYLTSDELKVASESKGFNNSYKNLVRVEDSPEKIDSFKWNENLDNTWENSTIYKALNNKFLNSNLKNSWSDMIEEVLWNVGGGTDSTYSGLMSTSQNAYQMEMTGSGKNTQVRAKIGLMYVHDYGFASANENWPNKLHCQSNDDNTCYWGQINRENNWLYNAINEWTISRNSGNTSNIAFYVESTGRITGYPVNNLANGIRPVFYLNENVKIIGGEGTKAKPYKVES